MLRRGINRRLYSTNTIGQLDYSFDPETVGQFNPFHSLETPFSSRESRELPGFHTATNKNMTAIYAQAAFEVSRESLPYSINYYDYPVIVGVNVLGLKSFFDWDAINKTIPTIIDVIDSHESYDDLLKFIDFVEMESKFTETAIEALEELNHNYQNPAQACISFFQDVDPEYGERIFDLIKKDPQNEKIQKLFLQWVGQYRYEDVIGLDRIVSIDYMTPFFPHILKYDASEKIVDEIVDLGFAPLTEDDYYYLSLELETVYQIPIPEEHIIQYHGTSYSAVTEAFPELELPYPPSPFWAAIPIELFGRE